MFHALAQEDRGDALYLPVFLRRLGQHIGGAVHTDHLVASQSQLAGQGAGAAGQIQYGIPGQTVPKELPLQVVRPFLVVYIFCESVITAGQKSIAAHVGSPFFPQAGTRGWAAVRHSAGSDPLCGGGDGMPHMLENGSLIQGYKRNAAAEPQLHTGILPECIKKTQLREKTYYLFYQTRKKK